MRALWGRGSSCLGWGRQSANLKPPVDGSKISNLPGTGSLRHRPGPSETPHQLSQEKRLQRLQSLRELAAKNPSVSMLDSHIDFSTLQELTQHPLLTFGAHGHSHHPLLSLDGKQLVEELHQCRSVLQEVCGKSYVDVLSFPFGHQAQVAPILLQRAMEIGFQGAMHADEGVARPGDHLYALPRLLLSKNSRIVEAYELQGLSTALDETLLVLTGAESARGDYLSG